MTNMLARLDKLKRRIPRLVRPELFAVENPDAVLELRDRSTFEDQWLRVHKALNELEQIQPTPETANQFIREIEEAAFKTVYAATGATGFTEFAPTVSEDFGLLARGLWFGYHDPWLSGLLTSYQRGVFPSGRIELSEIGLEELVRHDASP